MITRAMRATLLCCTLLSCAAVAQDLDSLLNMSAFTAESELQKDLNVSTTVSSSKALTTRETPGIINIVTAEDIQISGARDLTDVLRLIPGFDVAQDLQFVTGMALRGNWSNEGKVLVMLDGMPLNDLLYQTVALGNRFPVDAIQRIEIIRGPGSAIYGGSAEYGVINIITKAAESLNGIVAYGAAGLHSDAVGRTNGGVMVAKRTEDFSFDLSAFTGTSIISDAPAFQDLYFDYEPQDLSETTQSDPLNLNLGIRYKGLSVRGLYDRFKTADPFLTTSFESYFTDLRYDWKVSKKLTVTPSVLYTKQTPWSWGDKETGEQYFDVDATRMLGQIEAVYDLSRKVNLNVGVLYFEDEGKDVLSGEAFRGQPSLTLTNYAMFVQGLIKHRLANATFGFRYEKNSEYGAAFVPRMALTKKIENLHFKVLWSQAFRAPSLQNINIALTGTVKPERSNVFELELGYQFTPESIVSLNAFSLTTRDLLVYGSEGVNEDFVEWYDNATKTGTRGIEAIYSVRKRNWRANLTYSFSRAIDGDETVATYLVPQTTHQYAGMLSHKATLSAAYFPRQKLSISPTIIYGGKRYAYTEVDDNFESVATEVDPYVLANLFINHRDLLIPGLTIGAGVFDLLNERPQTVQAYNGGYAPIPGRSRELVLKVSYNLNFK